MDDVTYKQHVSREPVFLFLAKGTDYLCSFRITISDEPQRVSSGTVCILLISVQVAVCESVRGKRQGMST